MAGTSLEPLSARDYYRSPWWHACIQQDLMPSAWHLLYHVVVVVPQRAELVACLSAVQVCRARRDTRKPSASRACGCLEVVAVGEHCFFVLKHALFEA